MKGLRIPGSSGCLKRGDRLEVYEQPYPRQGELNDQPERCLVTAIHHWQDVDGDDLQTTFGDSPRVATRSGNGEVQLRVVRCGGSDRRAKPLVYAYLAVPISDEGVPLVITSVRDDGWWAMPVLLASGTTADVLIGMGYAVQIAELYLGAGDDWSVKISRNDAVIRVTALMSEDSTPFNAHHAYLTDTADSEVVFFGEEAAQRSAAMTKVDINNALFAEWGIDAMPQRAWVDQDLRPDRVLWRLPK